jgi:Rad3-related DNA helicase
MSLNVDNFKERAPELLFCHLAQGKNVLIDAPPGLGKTRSAAKVAIKLVKETGQRVVIIEPTKTLRSQVGNYIKEEDKEMPFHESKGWNDYECPIIKTFADSSLCSYRKNVCKDEKYDCKVLIDAENTRTSKLTITTFAKLLLAKGLFSDYNTVIIDESHGFENAETSFLQVYVMFNKLEEVAEKVSVEYPKLSEKLGKLAQGLSIMNERLGDSVPLTSSEIDDAREALGDPILRDAWLECARENKHSYYRTLYANISSLHFRMQNISNNVFFFYEGALYGRPKNMELEVANFFKNKNVALLSATVDNAIKHAKACGLDMRRFQDSDGLILKDYPEKRRKNRKLIALTDGPILGRSNEVEYSVVRMEANKILLELLQKFKTRTLVLFRGYNDQKLAWEFLEKTPISSRVHNVWQGEDPDAIDQKITKLKSSDIVLSSASTRLWEGVDIPNLRLVIIDALPYPGKDPLSTEYNFKIGHETMIKKMKQGLGRIVRSDDDWGAAVVIDNRFNKKFSSIASKLPWFMYEDFVKLSLKDAIHELGTFIKFQKG